MAKVEKRGGARPGAGRKPKPAKPLKAKGKDPLKFLLEVMRDAEADPGLRVRSAIAAAQYVHMKKGDGGKKDEQRERAEKVGQGRFAPSAAPRLVVNNS